jgi:hypothetical protein
VVAVQILKSIAADMVRIVIIDLPLVRGIAWMHDFLAVPNFYNLLLESGEMHPITIGYDNKDPNKEKLNKLIQEIREIGEQLLFKKK